MGDNTIIGQYGEEESVKHLLESGYKILATNWRHRQKEIDIVAQKGRLLVVVEVKTRSTRSAAVQVPYESVNRAKQRNLVEAAQAYLEVNGLDMEVRFDILSITYQAQGYEIEHLEDAFGPSW